MRPLVLNLTCECDGTDARTVKCVAHPGGECSRVVRHRDVQTEYRARERDLCAQCAKAYGIGAERTCDRCDKPCASRVEVEPGSYVCAPCARIIFERDQRCDACDASPNGVCAACYAANNSEGE